MTSLGPLNVWLGDYIFEPGRASIRAQIEASLLPFEGKLVNSHFSRPDVLIIRNLEYSDLLKALAKKIRNPKLPLFQIISEPKVVLPALNWRIWRLVFRGQITLGGDSRLDFAFPRPYEPEGSLRNNQKRSPKAVLVNANKFSWIRGENYSLRRAIVSSDIPVDTYGANWQPSRKWVLEKVLAELFRSLASPSQFGSLRQNAFSKAVIAKGPCESKLDVLSDYKVNLVIENSMELITEKLSDAWYAGCIPVYVGPDLSQCGVPDELIVYAEPNLKSVNDATHRALGMNHAKYQKNLRNWLESPEYKNTFLTPWAWEPIWRSIFSAIR